MCFVNRCLFKGMRGLAGGGGEQLDREAFRSEEKVRVEHALPARRFALSSFCESAEGGSPKTGGGGKGSGVQLNGISTNGSSDEMKSKQPAPAV